MKIGLDHDPVDHLFKMTPLQIVEMAIQCEYEGVMLSAETLLDDKRSCSQIVEKLRALNLYIELTGPEIDKVLSGKSTSEILTRWRATFPIAKELGATIIITGLGTWPWKGRVIQEKGKTVEDQIQSGIAILREVGKMAEDYGIIVAIHTSFFKAEEYLQIVEEVNLPSVALCLDTANAFLVLEDPVDFARLVAPFVRATHFKDTCIYLQESGMDWLGGCPLGRGLVDLPKIVDILYQSNPDTNLTIEDHWGRMTVPVFDQNFMTSLGIRNGAELAKLLKYLWDGQTLMKTGVHPTTIEANQIDWQKIFPERMRYNAFYAKRLRDQVIAKYQQTMTEEGNK
jgi:sugar phosphate isomerase/epimerase